VLVLDRGLLVVGAGCGQRAPDLAGVRMHRPDDIRAQPR
jgi:hypothetical protein